VRRGLVHCPERRRPFRELTVLENLRAGGYLCGGAAQLAAGLERAFALFPRLAERRGQIAGTLSGGEQQMLAIGRALMIQPKLLCIDEPSLGLAPKVRMEVFEAIRRVHALGIAVLLVEQEVGKVFQLAARNYILSQGRVVAEGTGAELTANETLRASYLGL
jgi:branched-chain amino acid transport system ATP-binding protein